MREYEKLKKFDRALNKENQERRTDRPDNNEKEKIFIDRMFENYQLALYYKFLCQEFSHKGLTKVIFGDVQDVVNEVIYSEEIIEELPSEGEGNNVKQDGNSEEKIFKAIFAVNYSLSVYLPQI